MTASLVEIIVGVGEVFLLFFVYTVKNNKAYFISKDAKKNVEDMTQKINDLNFKMTVFEEKLNIITNLIVNNEKMQKKK